MYRARGRVWIEAAEGTYIGYGRAVLLERVAEAGSIRAAAVSMRMSYRHAWELVDSMNRQGPRPLVEKMVGGRGGGGARLTPTGRQALAHFRGFHRRFQTFLERETRTLSRLQKAAGE